MEWTTDLARREARRCSGEWMPGDQDGFDFFGEKGELVKNTTPLPTSLPVTALDVVTTVGEVPIGLGPKVTFKGYVAQEVETYLLLRRHQQLNHLQRAPIYQTSPLSMVVDYVTGMIPDGGVLQPHLRGVVVTRKRRRDGKDHSPAWYRTVAVVKRVLAVAKCSAKHIFLGLRQGIFEPSTDPPLMELLAEFKQEGFSLMVVRASSLVGCPVMWGRAQFLLAVRDGGGRGLGIHREYIYTSPPPTNWPAAPKERLLLGLEEKGWWEQRNSAAILMRSGSPPLIRAAWDFLHHQLPGKSVCTLFDRPKPPPSPVSFKLNWQLWEECGGDKYGMNPPLAKPTTRQRLPPPTFSSYKERYRESSCTSLSRVLRLEEETEKEEKKVGIVVSPKYVEWAWGFPEGWADPSLFRL